MLPFFPECLDIYSIILRNADSECVVTNVRLCNTGTGTEIMVLKCLNWFDHSCPLPTRVRDIFDNTLGPQLFPLHLYIGAF